MLLRSIFAEILRVFEVSQEVFMVVFSLVFSSFSFGRYPQGVGLLAV